MNTKKTAIFFAIFVALVIVVMLFEKPFEEKGASKSQQIKKLFETFKPNAASAIEINQVPNQKFKLKKTDKGWVVESENNFPANGKEIEELLKKVAEFDNHNLISNNPEHQMKFQVNNIGIETKIMDKAGKDIAHFFVGKNDSTYSNTYVRVDGSNDVYTEKGYLKGTFDKSRYKWKNRDIFSFASEDVDNISIHSISDTKKKVAKDIVLQKSTEGEKIKWSLTKPLKALAKDSEVKKMLDSLSSAKADDFAVNKKLEDVGLKTPEQWIEVTMKDGMKYTLQIGIKEKGSYYIKSADKDYIYKASEYKIKSILKDVNDLKLDNKKENNKAKNPTLKNNLSLKKGGKHIKLKPAFKGKI